MNKKTGKPNRSEWTKAEDVFYKLCQKEEWYVEFAEDNHPILCPAKENMEGMYHIGVWSNNENDCTITANCMATKNAIRRKLDKKKIPYRVHLDGDWEAILLVNKKYLKKLVLTLDLKRKRRRIPSKEVLEALKRGREKYFEKRKNL